MSVVQLDFFDREDLNGAVIDTITDEDTFFESFEMRPALRNLGSGLLIASRQGISADAPFFIDIARSEAFVRVLVPEISSDYLFGFFLDTRKSQVLAEDESAGLDITVGGPGPLYYLSRGIFYNERFSGLSGFTFDEVNGIIRFPAGSTTGDVLASFFQEDAANTEAEFIPALTKDFSENTDSDGNAWAGTLGDGLEFADGTHYLQALRIVQEASADLDVVVELGSPGSPQMLMRAFNRYGRDLTGTTFGAGTVLWKAGINSDPLSGNILTGLEASGTSTRKPSHVLVRGANGSRYRTVKSGWAPGQFTKAVALDYPHADSVGPLNQAGLRHIRAWEDRSKGIQLEIHPGFDEDIGHYMPGPDGSNGHFWLGDDITLKTGGDVTHSILDYHYETQRVTGIRMVVDIAALDDTTETAALSWHVVPELNEVLGVDGDPVQAGDIDGGLDGGVGMCCGPHGPTQPADGACSRLYFSTEAASISTLASDASWADDGTDVVHLLKLAPDDTLGVGAGSSDFIVGVNVAAGSYVRDDGLDAFQITNAALLAAVQAGGIVARAQLTTRSRHGIGVNEAAQDDYQTWLARVYRAGTGFIGTMWGLTGGGTRFLPQSTFVNRSWAATSSAVAGAALNDWIVFEVGARHVGPTSGAAGAYYRLASDSSVGDLPVDEVTTSVLNTWIEICTAGSEDGSPPLTTVRSGEGSFGSPGTYVPVGSTVEMGLLSNDGQHYLNGSDIEYDPSVSGLTATDVQEAIDELAEVEAAPHAHDPPTPGTHKILVQRTTNFTTANSNDSVPDYDDVVEDTMTDSWWDAGDPDGFLVTADYDGLDVVFMAKGALSDPGTSDYLEAKMYFFPAASGRDRPIHASTDEQYLLAVEQQPATDNINHYIHVQSDPITVGTGDRLFVAWRTSTAQTLTPYDGRVSTTLGAYILGSGGGGAETLDELTDVTITAAASGDMLRHNGTVWVNTPGRWEVLMADGVSNPPDPLTNEAGTDWLYGWSDT